MMKPMLFIGGFLFLIAVMVPFHVFAYNLNASIEAALLNSDWVKVREILNKDDPTGNSPVERLLLGHASLAINQNNDALLFFLSVQDKSELSLWVQWTNGFMEQHQDAPVALYLAADALARMGSLQKAIARFTRIIKSPFSSTLVRAMALNAQGVAYVLTNNMEAAQVNFYLATKQAPKFADAFANRGTLNVFREASIRQGEGALEVFNQALALNPEFALAYNGRGCLYFGSGEFELATKDFEKAALLLPNLSFIETNLDFVAAYGKQLPILVSLNSQPGTSLTTKIEQQKVTLQAQQQEIKNLPDEKTILALPHMSSENQQAVVNKYGWKNVEKAAQLTLQKGQTSMIGLNQEVQKLHGQRKIIHKLELGLVALKAFQFGAGMTKNISSLPKEGGKVFKKPAEKAVIKATTDSHTIDVVVDAIDPNLVGSTMSSVQNIGESILRDQSGRVVSSETRLHQEAAHLGLQMRDVRQFVNTYPSSAHIGSNRIEAPSQITQREIGVGRNRTTQALSSPAHPKFPDSPQSPMRNAPVASPPINSIAPTVPQYTPPPSFKFQAPRISRFPQPPGGVDTEISAFIDKGNWPVLTVFGLFYQVKPIQ